MYSRSQDRPSPGGGGHCQQTRHLQHTQHLAPVRETKYHLQRGIGQLRWPRHAASGFASPAATTTMAGFSNRPFSVQAALQA